MRTAVLSLACTCIVSLCASSSISAQCFESVVTGHDTFFNDQFGNSADLSADYAVVGAHFHDGVGLNSGSAYIYERVGGVWQEAIELEASDTTGNDRYGWTVGLSGDVAVVGARYNDDMGYGSGSIYIYERGAGTWPETAKQVASVETSGDFFGNSVATSREIVAVGTPGYDGTGFDIGATYVIEKVAGVWTETALLTASDAEDGDNLGTEIAIDSGIIVVGAKGGDDFGANSGAAYVFEKSGGSWGQVAKLLPNTGNAGDGFGSSVAIHGKTIVVGSALDSDLGFFTGSAHVFEKKNGSWVYVSKLTASNAAALNYFGASVAVFEDVALIGAWGADAGGIELGTAYKFQRIQEQWIETSILTVSGTDVGDNFGFSVALSEGTGIISSRGEMDGGVAYFFTDFDKTPLYGSNCPGTGGFAPTLSMSGCPAPAGSASIDIKRGLGGSMAFLFIGVAPTNMPLPGGCNLLIDALPKFFTLPLSGGAAGQGQASLAVTIPTNLPSGSLYMQSFLLDSGVADGFTVTNGLELILP